MLEQHLTNKAEKIYQFSQYLRLNDIKKIEIFLSSMENFLIAFFAALKAEAKPLLARDKNSIGQNFVIDDEKFAKISLNLPKLDRNITDKTLSFTGNENFYLKTSGSTGEAKNIEKTLRAMVLVSQFLAKELNLSPNDEFLATVNHQNMYGLTFKFFLPLVLGAEVKEEEFKYPELLFEENLRNKILISSPTFLKLLNQHKQANKIKDLKLIISAGARLDDNLRKELEKISKARIIDIYGSSETGIIGRNLGNGLKKFSAVNVEIGNNKELIIQSSWCDKFISSDSGELKGDKIILQGRLDRIIKLSEKRIDLDFVEEKLRANPLLKDCKLGLHPDYERILALLVLSPKGEDLFIKNGKKAIVLELKEYLKSFFPSALLRYFKIVEKIPYSSASKVSREDFIKCYKDYQMPEIKQISKREFRAKISVFDFYFDGHFANFPIVAGFVQLKFVQLCAKKIGINLENSTNIPSIKFMHFIRPNDEIFIFLDKVGEKVQFSIKTAEKECCNGKISL